MGGTAKDSWSELGQIRATTVNNGGFQDSIAIATIRNQGYASTQEIEELKWIEIANNWFTHGTTFSLC